MRIISADSHVTETPDVYKPRMAAKFRDQAPYVTHDADKGDLFVIPGMKATAVPVGLIAAAGKKAEELATFKARFDDLHHGGWDPNLRIQDQERDGISAEILYPTVGMVLCNHPDIDYKKACFDAYNLWLAEYCSAHPDRLFGMGQTAMRTPDEGIEDIKTIKKLGLRGVMMPGNPGVEDYDSKIYEKFYETAIDLGTPLAFHILTSSSDGFAGGRVRGPKLNRFLSIIRGCQDIIGTFILGGVFERHPQLKLVCVEADAGWVPHYMYRMDHGYDRHRYWLKPGQLLSKKPSEYFRENVYTTFQDDWVAFQMTKMVNPKRLMWANDFPHSDATWPHSQEVLREHTAHLSDWEKKRILHDNVAELFNLEALETEGNA
jgi:predicted TIM-barrel fold metal-dependent hydrolase